MKNPARLLLIAMFFLAASVANSAPAGRDRGTTSASATNAHARLLAFAAAKERQVTNLAAKLKMEVPPEVRDFFEAARHADWPEVSSQYEVLRDITKESEASGNERRLGVTAKQAALELSLAVDALGVDEPKFLFAAGERIVKSIPPGAIYFGGTDPGRGLPTALCASHEKGDPFFTLTQNALADASYLLYLRTMYGNHMAVPTEEDSSRAFKDYVEDAKKRLEHDEQFPKEPRQVKPGESVRLINGKAQVSGQVAVMAINGRLAQAVFAANPQREFYIEESFPLDWMYPHLAPHGFIMRLHRTPLDTVPPETLEKDRAFWREQVRPLLGDWLQPETSVREICAFVEKIHDGRDFTGFRGDRAFVNDRNAFQMYSKLRSSQAGVYAWRLNHTKRDAEKQRMLAEADFAFRQAWALCPSSPEAVFRYVNLLISAARVDDAVALVEVAKKVAPRNRQMETLLTELRRLQGQSQPASPKQ